LYQLLRKAHFETAETDIGDLLSLGILGGLRERYKLPPVGSGRSPDRNWIWCILALNVTSGGNNFTFLQRINWPNSVQLKQ